MRPRYRPMRMNLSGNGGSAPNALQQSGHALRRRAREENFPVALRVLPKPLRRDLHAVYAVARTIDDVGDVASGVRVDALNEFRVDLHRIWDDRAPQSTVLQALVPTVRARGLTAEPFADLIGYCQLSADPVGQLVLDVFGQRSTDATQLSNEICRALQLLEHWQDVA